jgi:hypothetical protein
MVFLCVQQNDFDNRRHARHRPSDFAPLRAGGCYGNRELSPQRRGCRTVEGDRYGGTFGHYALSCGSDQRKRSGTAKPPRVDETVVAGGKLSFARKIV